MKIVIFQMNKRQEKKMLASQRNFQESGQLNDTKQIFVTRDKNLLSQYYNLRNDIFKNEKGLIKNSWLENEFDDGAAIVVAAINGRVVGGIRVMTSIGSKYLSREISGTEFTYRNLLRTIGLNSDLEYIETSCMVIAPEYRNRTILSEMMRVVIEYGKKLNGSYLIDITSLAFARNIRMIFRSLGYPVTIVASFPWKELEMYNYSKDYPVVCLLNEKTE